MTDFQKSLIATACAFVLALLGIAGVAIGVAFGKDAALTFGLAATFFALFVLGRQIVRT